MAKPKKTKLNVAQLRTLFDNASSEWDDTTLDEKINKLRVITSDRELLEVIVEFNVWLHDVKKVKNPDFSIMLSLVDLLQHLLRNSEDKPLNKS